jgi:acetate kinase
MLERLDALDALAPLDAAHARVVTLQLGNGCSATAVDHGRSIDTSMGLTPLEGLVMGTRSGDVDPSLAGYLARMERVDVDVVEAWLNTRAGLLGVSGRSRDMREVLAAAHDGDARAALAVETFCYRARRYVGGYLAALGGADAVVFGGGIGEHAPEVRARVLDGMQWCGIDVDAAGNDAAVDGRERRVSTDQSAIAVWVVHVDEAAVVARDAARVLNARS